MSDISNFISQFNDMITETSKSDPKSETSKSETSKSETSKSETNSETKSDVLIQKSIKILIVSTHINQSNGYSKVIYNIIKELVKYPWINIVHFGTHKLVSGDIGRNYPKNVKAIDGTAMDKNTEFAFQELPNVINSEKPDIVFIYNDMSIVCSYIQEIRKLIHNRFFKIWAYLDITYKNPPQNMIDDINRDVERIFCFTKSWKDELKSKGITRPVDIMNHGLDTTIRSIPKELARQRLGLPKDVILYTSLNKNIPRKRLDILVMSFAKLIARFPLKPLYMLIVADIGTHGGFSLFDIFSREIVLCNGSIDILGTRLLITSKDTCYKDDDINILYNCGDIGVSCAEGEGFGLCTFEQMSLGIPQIVPEINGYTEYCNKDNSIMIKPTMRYYIPHSYNSVTGEAQIVDPEDVSRAMEKYAFDENVRKLHGKLAMEKVKEYTWDKCCSIFIKRLKMLQEDD